jgi:hypothetical protein
MHEMPFAEGESDSFEALALRQPTNTATIEKTNSDFFHDLAILPTSTHNIQDA